jgi:hypothetical protein
MEEKLKTNKKKSANSNLNNKKKCYYKTCFVALSWLAELGILVLT